MPNDSLPTAPSGEAQTDDARKGIAVLRTTANNRRAAGSPMGDAIERYADALDDALARLASLSTERARMEREREAYRNPIDKISAKEWLTAKHGQMWTPTPCPKCQGRHRQEFSCLAYWQAYAKALVGDITRMEYDRSRASYEAANSLDVAQLDATCANLAAEVSRLTSELDRVRGALNTYGQHLGYCSTQHMTSAACDCGYDDALGTPDATTRREG